jgi:ribosomal protein S18 acetylase RimI-like enzyme
MIFRTDKHEVDWGTLKQRLQEDNFDNGRSVEQYRRSFQNSYWYCLVYHESMVIGTARVLSDGICNAYVVDVWTYTPFRRQGIAKQMMNLLVKALPGQHIYLFTDDSVTFYEQCSFAPEAQGMGLVSGKWLDNKLMSE